MNLEMTYDTNKYQLKESAIKRMLAIIQQREPGGIVFYGDSLIENYDLKSYFHQDDIYNCGIAGLTSDMLLHFVEEGVVKYKAKKVFILVGTNDLGETIMASPRDIALNMKELVEIIYQNLLCQIYVISPLPCNEAVEGYHATGRGIRNNDFLKMIFTECKKMIPYHYVTWIDVFSAFKEKLNEVYMPDGLHINESGYALMSKLIKSYVEE